MVLTSNARLLDTPGNVLLRSADTGLPKDSMVHVTQVATLHDDYLVSRSGRVPARIMARVDASLRLILDLQPTPLSLTL